MVWFFIYVLASFSVQPSFSTILLSLTISLCLSVILSLSILLFYFILLSLSIRLSLHIFHLEMTGLLQSLLIKKDLSGDQNIRIKKTSPETKIKS